MNRKIILILSLILMLSLTFVAAQNHTDNLSASDTGDGDALKIDDKNKLADGPSDGDEPDNDKMEELDEPVGAIKIKKIWNDNNDAAGKRPKSVTCHFVVDGESGEALEITADNNWEIFIQLPRDIVSAELVEDPVEGYNTTVTGDVASGFNITNTLAEDTPKDNKTDNNSTPDNNNTDGNSTPTDKDSQKPNITTTTTTKIIKQAQDNKTKKPVKDKHNTGYPILLGLLALSGAGLAIKLRRKD